MAKHRFKITVEPLADNEHPPQAPLVFTAESHDDLIGLAAKTGFKDDAALSFFLGLKLFGEALLRDRENPLYQEIFPVFGSLMKKLKNRSQESSSTPS